MHIFVIPNMPGSLHRLSQCPRNSATHHKDWVACEFTTSFPTADLRTDKSWWAWKDNKSICPLQPLMESKLKPKTFYLSRSYDGWVGIFCDLTAAEQRCLTYAAAADKKSCKRKGIRVCSDDNNIFVYFLLPNTYGQSIKDLLVRGLLYIFFWNHCRRKLHQMLKKKKTREKKHIAFCITYEDRDILRDKELHLKPCISQSTV